MCRFPADTKRALWPGGHVNEAGPAPGHTTLFHPKTVLFLKLKRVIQSAAPRLTSWSCGAQKWRDTDLDL